jgi:hypothetical protein
LESGIILRGFLATTEKQYEQEEARDAGDSVVRTRDGSSERRKAKIKRALCTRSIPGSLEMEHRRMGEGAAS